MLAAAFFSDPKFEERNGLGYDSVQRVTDGHRFGSREELQQRAVDSAGTQINLQRRRAASPLLQNSRLTGLRVVFPGSRQRRARNVMPIEG